MYSDSPEDTADIVGMLQKKEAAKGHAFPSPLDIGDRERRVLPLYQVDSDSTWEGGFHEVRPQDFLYLSEKLANFRPPAESFLVIQKRFRSSNYTLGAKITLGISL